MSRHVKALALRTAPSLFVTTLPSTNYANLNQRFNWYNSRPAKDAIVLSTLVSMRLYSLSKHIHIWDYLSSITVDSSNMFFSRRHSPMNSAISEIFHCPASPATKDDEQLVVFSHLIIFSEWATLMDVNIIWNTSISSQENCSLSYSI